MSENPEKQLNSSEAEGLEDNKPIRKQRTPEEMAEVLRRNAIFEHFPASDISSLLRMPKVQEIPEEAEEQEDNDSIGPSDDKKSDGAAAA